MVCTNQPAAAGGWRVASLNGVVIEYSPVVGSVDASFVSMVRVTNDTHYSVSKVTVAFLQYGQGVYLKNADLVGVPFTRQRLDLEAFPGGYGFSVASRWKLLPGQTFVFQANGIFPHSPGYYRGKIYVGVSWMLNGHAVVRTIPLDLCALSISVTTGC